MTVTTVSAPANIAFVKYWGARDLARALPYHPSISMTLEVCRSLTSVEAIEGGDGDEVFLAGDGGRLEPAGERFAVRVRRHLDAVRAHTGRTERFRVATRNSFPAAAGLASSASGFAALAVAVARALGLEGEHDLSVLARLSGSGSASRSVHGGFVEWPAGAADDDLAPADRLAPASHWDLACVIAVVETGEKEVSSLDGHRRATTSPHFARRLELVPERLDAVRGAIRGRDLSALGPVLETDAVELHTIAMTSVPPIFYWSPGTLEVLAAVRDLRRDGVAAYATMDAGANVHVICEPVDAAAVADRLNGIESVVRVIRDRAGDGPRSEAEELL